MLAWLLGAPPSASTTLGCQDHSGSRIFLQWVGAGCAMARVHPRTLSHNHMGAGWHLNSRGPEGGCGWSGGWMNVWCSGEGRVPRGQVGDSEWVCDALGKAGSSGGRWRRWYSWSPELTLATGQAAEGVLTWRWILPCKVLGRERNQVPGWLVPGCNHKQGHSHESCRTTCRPLGWTFPCFRLHPTIPLRETDKLLGF